MILYDYTSAPNPRRVRIFLSEKNIDVPLEQVDIMKRENRQEPFLAKNPLGGVPVLELDDGTCIAESISICRYFEEMHPQTPLFGSTPKEKAIVDMWLRRVELNLMMPVGMVWVHGHELTAGLLKQIPEVAEQNRVRCAQSYAFFDKHLGDTEFMAGNAYTVVDAAALATVDFAAGLVGVAYDPALENLKRWHEAMSARPSARA